MIATTNTSTTIPTSPGRLYQAAGIGTYDGATVTMDTYVDGDWYPVPDGQWTESFEVVRANGDGTQLRLTITGAGASTSISLNLTEIANS